MRKCYIPGCAKQHSGKRLLFSLPKKLELLEKWYKALPMLRTVGPRAVICDMHFQPSDVEKVFSHNIDGKIYIVNRERAHLKPNSIPSRNLPTGELAIQPVRRKVRKNQISELVPNEQGESDFEVVFESQTDAIEPVIETNRISQNANAEKQHDDNMEPNKLINEQFEKSTTIIYDEIPNLNDCNIFNNLFDNVDEVLLPNTLWGIHRCPSRNFLMFVYMSPTLMTASKILIVDNIGTIKSYLSSRLISETNFPLDMVTTKLISKCIEKLDIAQICAGADASEDCLVELKHEEKLCVECFKKLASK